MVRVRVRVSIRVRVMVRVWVRLHLIRTVAGVVHDSI